MTTSVESPGANCAYGGTRLVSASGTTFACDGSPGFTRTFIVRAAGTAVANGALLISTIAAISPAPTPANPARVLLDMGTYDLSTSTLSLDNLDIEGASDRDTFVVGTANPMVTCTAFCRLTRLQLNRNGTASGTTLRATSGDVAMSEVQVLGTTSAPVTISVELLTDSTLAADRSSFAADGLDATALSLGGTSRATISGSRFYIRTMSSPPTLIRANSTALPALRLSESVLEFLMPANANSYGVRIDRGNVVIARTEFVFNLTSTQSLTGIWLPTVGSGTLELYDSRWAGTNGGTNGVAIFRASGSVIVQGGSINGLPVALQILGSAQTNYVSHLRTDGDIAMSVGTLNLTHSVVLSTVTRTGGTLNCNYNTTFGSNVLTCP